MENNYD